MKAKKKRPTLAQTKAIYNAGLRSYRDWYAMMVDDIMYGVKAPAKRAGVYAYYDSPWFLEMSRHIRAFTAWEMLTEDQRSSIHELLKSG